MSIRLLTVLALTTTMSAMAQTAPSHETPNTAPSNIYKIKEAYLKEVLHNPAEESDNDEDNELTMFNRWFHMMEPRCYPSGNMPKPEVLLKAMQSPRILAKRGAQKTTAGGGPWQPLGPVDCPSNHNGIGRVNVIAMDKADTATIFVGTAGGGVWVTHNSGATWKTTTDRFPSISIADIVINPKHRDTIYVATGDGYGYEVGSWNIFWGGLYSAGVMRSTDSGNTWTTTGLSYIQSDRDMVQKLLVHPNKTSIILAATRNGLKRSTDAGATWTNVATGHIYSMAFKPDQPDTVYAIDNNNLIISYNAGLTWTTRFSAINSGSRCTIGVSPVAPNSIWVLTNTNVLRKSVNRGATFTNTGSSPASAAQFWGYYDRVLAVSPTDSNLIYACGKNMGKSTTGGNTWSNNDPTFIVHVDYHSILFNPLRSNTVYCGNDGGISVSRSGGNAFTNISNGLMISQIYRVSCSEQDTSVLLCGLQDNGTFHRSDLQVWQEKYGGDGMDNAIAPYNDYVQVASYQNGNFAISYDQGNGFSTLLVPTRGSGAWVSPVVITPRTTDTIFFGLKDIYATYDGGLSFTALTTGPKFSTGAVALAVAPSNNKYIYAASNGSIIRTTNGGTLWSDITGTLPTTLAAITHIAVDYKNPLKVYVTLSGYNATYKVFRSLDGGTTWTNFSNGLPNLPANCVAVDSTQPDGVFVGTDMSVYYRDSTDTAWAIYNTGLPNVMVYDLDINYKNYKIRAATFGRGLWEAKLLKDAPIVPSEVKDAVNEHFVRLYPNPTTTQWRLNFIKPFTGNYTITVSDISGKVISKLQNSEIIDASGLAKGAYSIDIMTADNRHQTIKAIKY